MNLFLNFAIILFLSVVEIFPFFSGRIIHILTWQRRDVIDPFNFITSAELFLLYSIVIDPTIFFIIVIFFLWFIKKYRQPFKKTLIICTLFLIITNILLFLNYTTVFLNQYIALGHITAAKWLVTVTLLYTTILFYEIFRTKGDNIKWKKYLLCF